MNAIIQPSIQHKIPQASPELDTWSFNGNSRREHEHGYFHYPAMMVPQMITKIIKELEEKDEINVIGDPFAGSGTVLTESMLHGKSFIGKDINPLAILLCKTKSGPFFSDALQDKSKKLMQNIQNDKSFMIDVSFPNINKWFQPTVQIELAKIRRAILKEKSLWARRFFWIVLAETVRLTSNSRISTYKLHIRPHEEMLHRNNLDVKGIFTKILQKNLQFHFTQQNYLKDKNLLDKGKYKPTIEINFQDARTTKASQNALCDAIITSPPYGDNTTTVPYGQFSYLPLQWIDILDIDPEITPEYIQSAYGIDAKSLGGSKKVLSSEKEFLCDISPALKRYIDQLATHPADREKRILAFFRDFHSCLLPTCEMLKENGKMVWILGNRQVGGIQVPFDQILPDMLQKYNIHLETSLIRPIPGKRMASKNNISDTISKEIVLIFTKA